MLKLIIDNTKKQKEKELITCRNSCELYDPFTEECGIFNRVDIDDPSIAIRCGSMVPKGNLDEIDDNEFFLPSSLDDTNEELDNDYVLTEDVIGYNQTNTFYEYNGDEFEVKETTYPLKPDYPAKREDAVWFISDDKSFGCWIINKSSSKFIDVNKHVDAPKGWHDKVYQSTFPLHDHNAPLTIASNMVWYVDQDGYGQYALLHEGRIGMVSSPRPKNWTPNN